MIYRRLNTSNRHHCDSRQCNYPTMVRLSVFQHEMSPDQKYTVAPMPMLQRTAARNLEDIKNDLFEIKKRLKNSPSAASIETDSHVALLMHCIFDGFLPVEDTTKYRELEQFLTTPKSRTDLVRSFMHLHSCIKFNYNNNPSPFSLLHKILL